MTGYIRCKDDLCYELLDATRLVRGISLQEIHLAIILQDRPEDI